jgi:phosphoenolpyruvate carboxylase
MDWQLAAPTLLELILCVVVFILVAAIGLLYSHVKQLRITLSESEHSNAEAISRIESLAKNANNQQTEAQARTLVITRHLKELGEKQTDIENQLRELKLQDPSLRLYQRAADLVKQGASIEEIIEACDIPRAEAEMIVMVHKQHS